MKNEESRLAVKLLLTQYLQGTISVKDMLQLWPSVDDPLLNTLCNTFVENVSNHYTDADIARLGLKALDRGANEEDFDRSLNALSDAKGASSLRCWRYWSHVRDVLRRIFGR